MNERTEQAALQTETRARFGSRSVTVRELTLERCRIEHRSPVRLHVESELVIQFRGETLFLIASAERSRCTGFDPILGAEYESELRCIHADVKARETLARIGELERLNPGAGTRSPGGQLPANPRDS